MIKSKILNIKKEYHCNKYQDKQKNQTLHMLRSNKSIRTYIVYIL